MNANYHAAGKTIAAGRKQSTLLGNATKNANWIAAGKDPAQERSKRGRNAVRYFCCSSLRPLVASS